MLRNQHLESVPGESRGRFLLGRGFCVGFDEREKTIATDEANASRFAFLSNTRRADRSAVEIEERIEGSPRDSAQVDGFGNAEPRC